MKIIMYSVREDEKYAINKYAFENNIEIDTITDQMNKDTAYKVKGYDGVSILQTSKVDDEEVYQTIHDNGINQIALRSAGYDIINFEYANKYNIKITNIPAYSPHAIAEMALTHTMNMIRHMPTIIERNKKQNYSWPGLISKEISDIRIGIIGVGRIGSVYAKIMNALGAKVIGYDIKINEDNKNFITYMDNIDEVYKQADVISMHVPHTPITEKMINKESIAKMKDGVIFINTARGPIVETKDVVQAIDDGKISCAGMDVVENEAIYFGHDCTNKEIIDDSVKMVINHPKIMTTPHVAFYTYNAVENMVNIALNSVVDIANGKIPYSIVTKEVNFND